MPIIQVHLMEGRTDSQKQDMMRRVTEAVVETLGVPPSTVRVLIQELASGHFAVGGEPRFAGTVNGQSARHGQNDPQLQTQPG